MYNVYGFDSCQVFQFAKRIINTLEVKSECNIVSTGKTMYDHKEWIRSEEGQRVLNGFEMNTSPVITKNGECIGGCDKLIEDLNFPNRTKVALHVKRAQDLILSSCMHFQKKYYT